METYFGELFSESHNSTRLGFDWVKAKEDACMYETLVTNRRLVVWSAFCVNVVTCEFMVELCCYMITCWFIQVLVWLFVFVCGLASPYLASHVADWQVVWEGTLSLPDFHWETVSTD